MSAPSPVILCISVGATGFLKLAV